MVSTQISTNSMVKAFILCIVLLALTGLWLWFRRTRRIRRSVDKQVPSNQKSDPVTVPRPRLSEEEYEKQQACFLENRADLSKRFFSLVSISGIPKGLTWKSCDFSEEILWVIEKQSADLHALISAVIYFEAIAGGPMEEVEAVGNARVAPGLFYFNGEHWDTSGHVLFNLDPEEVLTRHKDDYDRWASI
ncbi:MAG: hypothetical protein VX738_13380 [Planctomycetota bacterium]|nr:hypothetical protein [Planctomycetota bacterium]